MLDAVVVGAGQAGLGASCYLQQEGREHAVLERGRVGETWRSQRWDSFSLNTPTWMNRLPGIEEDLEPRDGFLLRDEYVRLLEGYAARFTLPVRTGVTVTGVERSRRDGSFVVHTDAPDLGAVEARNVIVASGIQRVPKIPPIAASLPPAIAQLHTADYRNPGQLPPGAVLVVGSAQSGGQIVEDLLDAGRAVYLSTSAVARLRRRYRGRDVTEWLVGSGFYDLPLDRLPDPTMRFAAQPILSGTGRYGHTLSLQYLAERGAILLGRLRAVRDGRLDLDDTLARNIRFADQKSAEFNRAIENGLRDAGIDLPPLEPDPADAPHPDPDSVRSPERLDLEACGIGSVVWATGFTGEFGWLRLPVLDHAGAPIHERGVSPVPGLYFLGFPWLHSRKSGIILGVDADAGFIAGHLAARTPEG